MGPLACSVIEERRREAILHGLTRGVYCVVLADFRFSQWVTLLVSRGGLLQYYRTAL